jgi:hypothetical protein
MENKIEILSVLVPVIVAIIGLIGVFFKVVLPHILEKSKIKTKEYNLTIYLRDEETGNRITGSIFIDNAVNGTYIDAVEPPPNILLSQGRHDIQAKSEGYVTTKAYVDQSINAYDITLRKDRLPPPLDIPFPFTGWYPWPENAITITVSNPNNGCIINSNGLLPDAAGIVNANLGTALIGKTLILYFSNTDASAFHGGQMAKLEYADGDENTILPLNRIPNFGYVPVEDTPPNMGIEYKIPDNYNGRLNLVFYKAELKDLKITAYYK